MNVNTVLGFYRQETENPREAHYFLHTLEGVRSYSTAEFLEKTAGLATGLSRLGVSRGDRVMLLSDNRPEWHMSDLAVIDLGAADVPIYGTLTPSQIAYQAQDSGSVAAIVENTEQMAKFLEVRDQCPGLKHLIQIEGETPDGVLTFEDVVKSGTADDSIDLFWRRASEVKPEDLLTLIYTSGTTGKPKGVMLTHDNLVQNVNAAGIRAPVGPDDLGLEFLPLSHVFERMVGYLYMHKGLSKAYCSPYVVGDLLADIKPTVFAGVPRIYEKVYDKIMDAISNAPAIRRTLFNWARGAGTKATPALIDSKPPGGLSYGLADKLVLSKVRERIGGRIRFCISGGAPLPQFVNEFFHSMGIRILEGYGLTETSPVIAVNGALPGQTRIGTVGRPVDNVEVKIAEDGEVLTRGPNVMKGYWNLPDKTAEVFDDDGFFRTGDIGEIDADGFLRITDRKKDLIVTAGGKNIAPQPIENELKRSPFVDNALLVGDRKPYIIALFSPNSEELEKWAAAEGVEFADFEQLTKDPRVVKLFEKVVETTSAQLARYEQIKKFAVLPTMLTIDTGHLTPTLKVKRRVVEKEFSDLIEGLYENL